MRSETLAVVEAIQKSLSLVRLRLDRPETEKRIKELNDVSEDPSIWNDPQRARKTHAGTSASCRIFGVL